jgi:hypothetical protein
MASGHNLKLRNSYSGSAILRLGNWKSHYRILAKGPTDHDSPRYLDRSVSGPCLFLFLGRLSDGMSIPSHISSVHFRPPGGNTNRNRVCGLLWIDHCGTLSKSQEKGDCPSFCADIGRDHDSVRPLFPVAGSMIRGSCGRPYFFRPSLASIASASSKSHSVTPPLEWV